MNPPRFRRKPQCHGIYSNSPVLVGSVLLLSPWLLTSCQTRSQSGDPTDLDGPLFGASKPTTFVVAPESEVIHVRDLARVARILRRYKTLEAAEKALVRSAVAKRLSGLIALEIRRIQEHPARRAQREAIRKIRDPRVAREKMAELDRDVEKAAFKRVIAKLGNFVAVPLGTSDLRSSVAFAKIDSRGVQVADEAGEVDKPIAAITEGQGVETQTGDVATFIAVPPVPVTPP